MIRPDRHAYRMSFGVGGLLLNESRDVARLHNCGEAWEETITRALDQEIVNLPKAASQRRTLREISNRLAVFDADEMAFFALDADRQEQQALLWLACCRAYRFIREFAVEIIRERYLSYQLDLPLESFDLLFDEKAEWDEDLARISLSTRRKLRQIMFRIMREAGVISASNQIQTALLSSRVKVMIEHKDASDLAIFPGIALEAGPT